MSWEAETDPGDLEVIYGFLVAWEVETDPRRSEENLRAPPLDIFPSSGHVQQHAQTL